MSESMWQMRPLLLLLLQASVVPTTVDAWTLPPIKFTRKARAAERIPSFLKATSADPEPDLLEGATTFENWFKRVPGAGLKGLSHADFGNLRGLAITSSASLTSSSDSIDLMTVPKSIVLNSDFSSSDWDIELAQKLWKECIQGPSSPISGYLSFLTRGWSPSDLPILPPPTAPDSLRHWSTEKVLLKDSHAGENMLQLLDQQNQLWREKFSNVRGMTFEQFEWSMEVVHSRAFCGDFGAGGSPVPPLVSALVPIAAAIAGFEYYNQNPDPSDALMVGLALLAAAPTLFGLVRQTPPVAVLLPMIDSINHREEADSIIEYNPLSDAFVLSVRGNCLVQENDKTQVYISYGPKKDTELLLNYGFLRGVPLDGDSAARRRALAEAFLSRQS